MRGYFGIWMWHYPVLVSLHKVINNMEMTIKEHSCLTLWQVAPVKLFILRCLQERLAHLLSLLLWLLLITLVPSAKLWGSSHTCQVIMGLKCWNGIFVVAADRRHGGGSSADVDGACWSPWRTAARSPPGGRTTSHHSQAPRVLHVETFSLNDLMFLVNSLGIPSFPAQSVRFLEGKSVNERDREGEDKRWNRAPESLLEFVRGGLKEQTDDWTKLDKHTECTGETKETDKGGINGGTSGRSEGWAGDTGVKWPEGHRAHRTGVGLGLGAQPFEEVNEQSTGGINPGSHSRNTQSRRKGGHLGTKACWREQRPAQHRAGKRETSGGTISGDEKKVEWFQ